MADDRTDTDRNPEVPLGKDADDKLKRVEAELAGQATPENAGQDRATEEPLTGEVLVPYGENLTRKLSVDDLVKAHQRMSELARKEEELNSQIDKFSGLKALAQHLESLSPKQQAALKKVLAQPEILERPHARDDDDDDGDDLFDGVEARYGKRPDQPDDLSELRDKVDTIARYLAHDAQEKKQRSLRSQVGDLLEQFPVFRGEKQGPVKDLALDSILSTLAVNPDSDLEGLVRDRAQKYTSVLENTRKETVSQAGFGGSSAQPVSVGEKSPTADDLMSRKLPGMIDRAMQALGGRQG